MIYKARQTPLHSVRPLVGCIYCGVLVLTVMVFESPLLNLGVLLAVLAAGFAAGVGRDLLRISLYFLPFALVIAMINPIVSREGLTVLFRTFPVPLLSSSDEMEITLEATVYGLAQGFRGMVLILSAGLYSLTVNPDGVLKLLRRVSFRSALTATVATRMVPVLRYDAKRMRLAQRGVAGVDGDSSRLALFSAIIGSALDRSLDTAAALELRGYGNVSSYSSVRPPWSRQDIAFLLGAVTAAAAATFAFISDSFAFDPYPLVHMTANLESFTLLAVVFTAIVGPFAVRRGMRSSR